jgi:hypothetical protein
MFSTKASAKLLWTDSVTEIQPSEAKYGMGFGLREAPFWRRRRFDPGVDF